MCIVKFLQTILKYIFYVFVKEKEIDLKKKKRNKNIVKRLHNFFYFSDSLKINLKKKQKLL